MNNEAAFTWALRQAEVTWALRFRDAIIDTGLTDLTVDFVPVFAGIDAGSGVVADFIINTALLADLSDPVLSPINFRQPGTDLPVDDSQLIGYLYPTGDNMRHDL